MFLNMGDSFRRVIFTKRDISRCIYISLFIPKLEKNPDALRLAKEKIYAHAYKGRRYDLGNKLDWLKSNIELSLADERFNNELEIFLQSLMGDKREDEREKNDAEV